MISSSKQFSSTEEHTDCKDTNCNKKAKPLPISASQALPPLISAFGIPAEFFLPVSPPLTVTGKAININNKPQKHSIMKTSNYLIALAALTSLTLVGCSDNSFVNQVFGSSDDASDKITIGAGSHRLTRGETLKNGEAAAKLNNNFILYGFKYYGTEPTAASDVIDATKQQKVFDLYNVHYTEGTANTTESNTSGWEYVGFANHNGSVTEQTIKYWDHESTGYVFSAVTGTDITATKTESTTSEEDDAKYEKGWSVAVPAGGSLDNLYASDRRDVGSNTDGQVTLTFYSIVTKIRFAMYETVPGYSVQIDKFYYGKTDDTTPTDKFDKSSTTNFAINGDFRTLNATTATNLNITYYSSGALENHPKVTFEFAQAKTDMLFGTNIQPTEQIGTNSVEATYDQADKEYTCIIPYQSSTNNLSLKVDYTLTSTDGSAEKIHVKGATAAVPATFTQWKENFAYTYIFKITDNTNGHTGDGTDKAGLYPITFDACVVNAEDGIQETITTVSEPSITTYQKGTIVTENDEYVQPGDIYFSVMQDVEAKDITSAAKVYEVVNNGTEATTEEIIANYKNNFCVLHEIAAPLVRYIPLVGNADPAANLLATSTATVDTHTLLTPSVENSAKRFAVQAGKTYVIDYTYTEEENTKHAYKVVRVVGTIADGTKPVYTLAAKTGTITAANGLATYTITVSQAPILSGNGGARGATPLIKVMDGSNDVTTMFNITETATDGTYTIGLTAKAIAAGNKTYQVSFNGGTAVNLVVNLTYTFAPTSSVDVVVGNSNTFTVAVGTTPVTGAVIVNDKPGITIKETSTAGTYEVSAAAGATSGANTITVAGQSYSVNVINYTFDPAAITLTWGEVEAGNAYATTPTSATVLKSNGTAYSALTADMLSGSDMKVVGDDATITKGSTGGAVTVTAASDGGVTTFTYKNNAVLTVTVNKYQLNATAATIAKNTGSSILSVMHNGKIKSINVSDITVKYRAGDTGDWSTAEAGTYQLTKSGTDIRFNNISKAGNYRFEYKAGGTGDVVGYEYVKVQ